MVNTTLSNLYVEKASSEHPIALWMLNEKVDYVSHLSEVERQMHLNAQWVWDNCEVSNETSTSFNAPFTDSSISRVVGAIPATPTMDITLTSYFLLSDNLEPTLENFSIGFYSYISSTWANSISFGYQYVNTETLATVEVLQSSDILRSERDTWKFVSGTFDIPPADIASDIKLVIVFNVSEGGEAGEYDFLVNGLSVGQWSENFNKVSYGVTPSAIDTDIALPSTLYSLPAYPYGASGINGFYLSKRYELKCQNFGVPLVYGSSNTTKIYPNVVDSVNYPSVIFPGYGFLNEKGRHNTYTAEMWLRINSSAIVPRKIFGPISGTDGLYVDGPFLTFKLDKNIASHFVGEWFRPMLISIRVIDNSLTMLLNGEEVIRMSFITNDISLPTEFDELDRSQDWLGLYAYDDVSPVEIDTISIYSYSVPTEVIKRHWVWGQAVKAPEQTNSSINSITAFNDYAFANYSANYNYPDFANWKQAFYSNMIAGAKTLSFPEYQLPDFNLGTNTKQNLFDDIDAISPDAEDPDDVAGRKYLTLSPNEDWDSTSDYLLFSNFGVLNDPVDSIYGVFRSDGSAVNQTLFKIVNKYNGDQILVKINGTTVTYSYNISGVSNTLATKTITANTKFAAGLHVSDLYTSGVTELNRFFTDQSALSVYLAGDGTNKFTGRVYKFGFNAAFNNRKISELYTDGIFSATSGTATTLFDHVANYTLVALKKYGTFFADIAAAGYWEDYVPLSYFGKYITDYDGSTSYELDAIQFNLDFPEPAVSSSTEVVTSWTYNDLLIAYSTPNILLYSDLNNAFYTKWDNYEDMSQNSIKKNYFNTLGSALKSYVSFQYVADGANNSILDIPNTYQAETSGILDPASIDADWSNTAYELITGTVIYPPTTRYGTTTPVNFTDLAIVYHLEFESDGILHHPIKFRELQLASQVLERTKFTPVGSRFGIPVYYYSKTGLYYDLKGKNPITTYKKSTPHLYLNRQSGWKLRGEFDQANDRGLAIPINAPKAENTEVSSIQMWIRFADKEFPADPIRIFSITHNDGIYEFFIQADITGQRGNIFAVDQETNEYLYNLRYFVNGQAVGSPFMNNEEWIVLGIEFPELLDFSDNSGNLSLNGPLTYNNVSYNLATNIERQITLETNTWQDIYDIAHVGTISDISSTGTAVTYTTNKDYFVGDIVTISGVNPSGYNKVNAVVTAATDPEATIKTFTIASTATGSYITGGTATVSSWRYVQQDIPVQDESTPPYAWQQVKIIRASRKFKIDPKAIYEKYTGSNRTIIDDESSGILLDPERIKVFSEISWSGNTKTAV